MSTMKCTKCGQAVIGVGWNVVGVTRQDGTRKVLHVVCPAPRKAVARA